MFGHGFLKNMQPLNFLKDYYGEKFGFYFAWLVHYTGWLISVAMIGVGFGIYAIINTMQTDSKWDHVLDTPASILYGLIIMIWATLLNESWKRKQNLIGNEWLVREFKDVTTERSDFRYEAGIDSETQEVIKITKRRSEIIQICVGIPLSLFFMGLVVASQGYMLYSDY